MDFVRISTFHTPGNPKHSFSQNISIIKSFNKVILWYLSVYHPFQFSYTVIASQRLFCCTAKPRNSAGKVVKPSSKLINNTNLKHRRKSNFSKSNSNLKTTGSKDFPLYESNGLEYQLPSLCAESWNQSNEIGANNYFSLKLFDNKTS